MTQNLSEAKVEAFQRLAERLGFSFRYQTREGSSKQRRAGIVRSLKAGRGGWQFKQWLKEQLAKEVQELRQPLQIDETVFAPFAVDHSNGDWTLVLFEPPENVDVGIQQVDYDGKAALLWMKGENRAAKFLFGRDERQWFVVEVDPHASSVRSAKEYLMPDEVREAVRQGLKVHRQGDWFFVPFAGEIPENAIFLRNSLSRHSFALDRSHIPEEVAKWSVEVEESKPFPQDFILAGRQVWEEFILVRGKVWHRSDHSPLELGSVWHRAYRNAAVREPRQTFDSRYRIDVD